MRFPDFLQAPKCRQTNPKPRALPLRAPVLQGHPGAVSRWFRHPNPSRRRVILRRIAQRASARLASFPYEREEFLGLLRYQAAQRKTADNASEWSAGAGTDLEPARLMSPTPA